MLYAEGVWGRGLPGPLAWLPVGDASFPFLEVLSPQSLPWLSSHEYLFSRENPLNSSPFQEITRLQAK